MIAEALAAVQSQLNDYLIRQFDLTENIVVLSNLADTEGRSEERVANKVAITLVNITQERNAMTNQRGSTGLSRSDISSPILVNVSILVSAHFSGVKYAHAVNLLSAVVGFFHATRVFDHANTPDLDTNIDKLIIELEDANTQDLSNLWSIHGGRYTPSVLYRLRVVSINADQIRGEIPTASEPETSVGGR